MGHTFFIPDQVLEYLDVARNLLPYTGFSGK